MSFYKALAAFSSGMKSLGQELRNKRVGNVFEQARLKADEINASEYEDDKERVNDLRSLRAEFASQMSSLGVNAQQISQMANNFSASESAIFQSQENERLLNKKFEQQKELIEKRAEEERITASQIPAKMRDLPTAQVDKLSEAVSSIKEMEFTLDQFEKLEEEGVLPATGPGSNVPFRQIINNVSDKAFAERLATFRDAAEQRALEFQKLITGVSGSPEQLAQIRKAIPSVDKTPTEFRAGLQQSIELAKQRLKDRIKTLEGANFSVNRTLIGIDGDDTYVEFDSADPLPNAPTKKVPKPLRTPQAQATIDAAKEITNNPQKYSAKAVRNALEVLRRVGAE